MEEKIKVIIIAGPTASSKSEIAFQLATEIKGEIINADSVQVYKYFDIGSAKPSKEIRKLIPHHLIDIINPDEEFNAFTFKELARKAVTEINERGKIPIMVGGTGLYIRCFLYDLFLQDEEKIKRERKILEKKIEKDGLEQLYKQLTLVDPKAAAKIHPRDRIRITRALEFFHATGKRLSDVQQEYSFRNSIFDFKIFIPHFSREELLKRIEKRTINIFSGGIIEEVKTVLELGYERNIKPLKSIGYKEALMVIDGLLNIEEAINETIKSTRAYAKRQIIWFKKEKNSLFIPMTGNNFENFFREVKLFLHKN